MIWDIYVYKIKNLLYKMIINKTILIDHWGFNFLIFYSFWIWSMSNSDVNNFCEYFGTIQVLEIKWTNMLKT